jgi:creatinine amidohydrolase/Fe(II)-dependent formamide hydrolase-like protein
MAEMILRDGSGSIPELTKEDEELLIKYHEEGMTVGHACMYETANMMGICPENVHLERLGIESGLSNGKADYLREAKINIISGGWDINYPNSFTGHDPVGCNERIGKASIRIAAEIVASKYKLLKEDTNLEKWLLEDYQKGW